MGYIRHHAIIVIGWDKTRLEVAHNAALGFFESNGRVGETLEAPVNGYASFFIGPDGSKEGWESSNEGDRRRANFLEWLETSRYEDRSGHFDWAEVVIGPDDGNSWVSRHTWEGEKS
jgi:hypothetical protein